MRLFKMCRGKIVEDTDFATAIKSLTKCDPIKCPHERCQANGGMAQCPIIQNGVSMKVTDKRTKETRLSDLKSKQVFEYVNKGHKAHRSIYQVLEKTQYLEKPASQNVYVLDLKTLKVCSHYYLKRVKVIEEHKTREMPKELREMLEAVGRIESMAKITGIEIPDIPPEIRELLEMLGMQELSEIEIGKSPSTCIECPMKFICPFNADKCPIPQTMKTEKPKKKAPPSVGTIEEKTVYEYTDQRNEWAQGYFVKLNQYQRLSDRMDPALSWVINLSSSRLCHHRNSNPVRILDAEFTING